MFDRLQNISYLCIVKRIQDDKERILMRYLLASPRIGRNSIKQLKNAFLFGFVFDLH